MKILFLGDIVGNSGCLAVKKNLPEQIKNKNIDFVIVNGENAADQGVGITEEICKDLFNFIRRHLFLLLYLRLYTRLFHQFAEVLILYFLLRF